MAQDGTLGNYLPSSLKAMYESEQTYITDSRQEKIAFDKESIETEGKIVKEWLALTKPPPFNEDYNTTSIIEAKKWLSSIRGSKESTLVQTKEAKTKIENEIKLRSAIPQKQKQKIDERLNQLKELPKRRESLKKTIEQIDTEIKQARENGLDDLVGALQIEKAAIEESLTGLDAEENRKSSEIQVAVVIWRQARAELRDKIIGQAGLVEKAIQVDRLSKDIEYLKNYEDDILDQRLKDHPA